MCEMEGGSYHLKLPYEVTEPAPVVVFLHGYGGSGRNTINIDRMVDPLLARGYAVIAPNGLRSRGDGPMSWNFFPGWEGREEVGFLTDVVADDSERFGTSPDTVLF